MDVIEEEQLLARADAVGARVRGRLEAFATRNDLLAIGNIRGLGAMLGFDIIDRDTGQPNGADARAVCARALEQGLMLVNYGVSGEAIGLRGPATAHDGVHEIG